MFRRLAYTVQSLRVMIRVGPRTNVAPLYLSSDAMPRLRLSHISVAILQKMTHPYVLAVLIRADAVI